MLRPLFPFLTSSLHPTWRSRQQTSCAGRAAEIAVGSDTDDQQGHGMPFPIFQPVKGTVFLPFCATNLYPKGFNKEAIVFMVIFVDFIERIF